MPPKKSEHGSDGVAIFWNKNRFAKVSTSSIKLYKSPSQWSETRSWMVFPDVFLNAFMNSNPFTVLQRYWINEFQRENSSRGSNIQKRLLITVLEQEKQAGQRVLAVVLKNKTTGKEFWQGFCWSLSWNKRSRLVNECSQWFWRTRLPILTVACSKSGWPFNLVSKSGWSFNLVSTFAQATVRIGTGKEFWQGFWWPMNHFCLENNLR